MIVALGWALLAMVQALTYALNHMLTVDARHRGRRRSLLGVVLLAAAPAIFTGYALAKFGVFLLGGGGS